MKKNIRYHQLLNSYLKVGDTVVLLVEFVEEVGFEPTLRFISPLQRRLNYHYSIPQYLLSRLDSNQD